MNKSVRVQHKEKARESSKPTLGDSEQVGGRASQSDNGERRIFMLTVLPSGEIPSLIFLEQFSKVF